MKFSPSDFFIGLIDFFSVLLPGAILCWTYKAWIDKVLNMILDPSDAAFIPVFLTAAYIAGHFVYSGGAVLDEYIYDYFRKLFYSKRDQAYVEADKIKQDVVTGKVSAGANDAINLYKWAKGVIEIQEPALIHAIHKIEADQKFFRSFVIVSLVNLLYFSAHCSWSIASFWGLVLLLSMYRYINRRFKGTRQAFETIIVMRSLGKL